MSLAAVTIILSGAGWSSGHH